MSLGVLVTYHNEGALLRECLESLLAQAGAPDEVLIYDDASADPPEPHVPRDERIRVLHGEATIGPARGRNVLLHASGSEYVHFHDADDLFRASWSGRVRNVIATHMPDFIVTEVSSTEADRIVCERLLDVGRLSRGEDPVVFCLRGAVITSASVLRRSLAVCVGGYRESLAQSEDYDFHVRVAAASRRTVVIEEPLIVKVLRSTSYSTSGRIEVWTSLVQSVRLLADELDVRYRMELAEAAARAGAMLFRLHARGEADAAFRLAFELGPPRYMGECRLYRWLARMLGPRTAEQVGALYRAVLPGSVRTVVRRMV